jgi:UDP-glucuronate 4-epimerase
MKKRYLITGCAGFIGYHLTYELLLMGHIVLGVDEINDYYSVDQKNRNLQDLKKFRNFVFYKVDICEHEKLLRLCRAYKITHIGHLAARAGVRPSVDNPFLYERSNVQGTLSILEIGKKLKTENIVLTSSSSVYGNRTGSKFKETDNTDQPVSPYASTKKACELLGYTYHYLHNLNINIIRPFTVYGERGRTDMAISMFIGKIMKNQQIIKYGTGTTYRDYTYVKDFVKGFISALDKPLGYEIFNLGNSNPVTLNELIETIESVCGKKAKIKEVKQPREDVDTTFADISKAKRMLNYNPQTTLKEGLKEILKTM